jgi:DNA invertase Pin-like site-specific DNA recombinase
VSTFIIPSCITSVNVFKSGGVWDSESYPYWCQCASVFSYARTSPRHTDPKYSHFIQRRDIEREVRHRKPKARIDFHIDEIGIDGRFLFSKHRPGFTNLIDRASGTPRPIVGWDLTRLLRHKEALRMLSGRGVHFITVQPLTMPEDELDSLRKSLAHTERERHEQLGIDDPELSEFMRYHFEILN